MTHILTKNNKASNTLIKSIFSHDSIKSEIEANGGSLLTQNKPNFKYLNHKSVIVFKCNCGEIVNKTISFVLRYTRDKSYLGMCDGCAMIHNGYD
jgi:hypothetical protein